MPMPRARRPGTANDSSMSASCLVTLKSAIGPACYVADVVVGIDFTGAYGSADVGWNRPHCRHAFRGERARDLRQVILEESPCA